MKNKRYQIFVSSTFEDLKDEREEVMRTILALGHFPSGMELFPSANDSQWEFIKKVIDECDYYIIIVAGMYGTINSTTGLSYTELEFNYAIQEAKKPVIGFVFKNIGELPKKKTESSEENQKALEQFRKKVTSKLVKFYTNTSELGKLVATSLPNLIKDYPSKGWIRSGMLQVEDYSNYNYRLATYLKKHEETFIQMPYREDLVAEVTYDEIRKGQFLVRDKVSYICRSSGGKLQEDLSWSIEPNEFIEVKKVKIEVKPPAGHRLSGQTYTLYEGEISPQDCITGFEIKASIPKEINVDGLRVTYDTEYIISSQKFNFWIMGNPTHGFTLTLIYPKKFQVQVKPFVQLPEAIDLTPDRQGYYKFKYDEWILPDDGLSWIFYKP